MSEGVAVDEGVDQLLRELARLARGGGAHGLIEFIALVGHGFLQFGRLETELEGAAQFLFAGGQGGLPLLGAAGQLH